MFIEPLGKFGELSSSLILKRMIISFFHHFSILNHRQSLAFLYSSQTMGNNDTSSTFHHHIQRFLHLGLTAFIQSTGSLIQNQNFGISHHSPRNSQSLFLASRQFIAFQSTLHVKTSNQLNVFQILRSIIQNIFHWLEYPFFLIFLRLFFQSFHLTFITVFSEGLFQLFLIFFK